MRSGSARAHEVARRRFRGLPRVPRPWLAAALGLPGLAVVVLLTPLILRDGICVAVPCDPAVYSPLGVTLADDRSTVQVAWPRCPAGGAIREVRVEQPRSRGGQPLDPLVLWRLQGNLDGTRPARFEVGRDHPGMRTSTPLRPPLPAGRQLRAVLVTTSSERVGILHRRVQVFTDENTVAFRVRNLRPGIVHWGEQLDPGDPPAMDDPRARWSAQAGDETAVCFGGPLSGHDAAWPAAAILGLLGVMAVPMAVVEGRRRPGRRPPGPPPPEEAARGWGWPRRP